MRDLAWRARNAIRRLAAGLPALDGPPSPEAPSAVYRTLGSIYRFAGGHVAGRAVLDWGCGTGFGSASLLAGGALSVEGTGPDAASLRYARRRFGRPGVDFRQLPLDLGPEAVAALPPFDALVAVNTLARLADPEATVPPVVERMGADGVLVASLPPILDGPTLELHRARHPRAARLFLWDWSDLLGGWFRELRLYRQSPPAGEALDLASPRPSRLAEDAFGFEEIPLDDLDNVGTLGAVVVASGPRP